MKTVLVVDDGPAELELICRYLRDVGYTVISTTDAKDALAKTSSHKPDVVVTDVVMPGMSGFELCRSIKKNEATRTLPVVICTSKDQDLDRLWGKSKVLMLILPSPLPVTI